MTESSFDITNVTSTAVDSSAFPAAAGFPPQQRRRLSQRDLALILYRKKLVIAILFALVFGTVAVSTFLKPQAFVASATILLKKERVDPVIAANDVSAPQKASISEQVINTEIEILKSAIILEQVVKSIGIERLLGANASESSKYTELDLEIAVAMLKRDLQIKPVPASNLIEVSYQSHDASLAAEVVNLACQFYLDRHLKVHESSGIYSFFQKQADELYGTLQAASESLRSYETSNGLIDPQRQRDLILQQLADYRTQLDQARMRALEAEQLVAFLEKRLQEDPKRIQTQAINVRNTVVETMGEELDSLEVLYKTLATADDAGDAESLNRRSRLARNIRLRIAQIEDTMMRRDSRPNGTPDADIQKTVMDISSDLARAKSQLISHHIQETELSAAIERLERSLDDLESAKLTHETLKRQWELVQGNYLLYAKKKEEARISDAMDHDKVANVSVIDPATVPLSPMPRNRKLSLVIGFLLALLVSIGVAFGLSYFDNLVRTGSEIERRLNIPVILVVPEGHNLQDGLSSPGTAVGALPFTSHS